MDNPENTYSIKELSSTSIFISKGNAHAHLIDRGSGIFLLDGIHGPGEGRVLLTMAIYEATRRGGVILELSAVANGAHIEQANLESFYKKFGFEEYGTRRQSGSIRMRKNLKDLPLIPHSILEEILQKNGLNPQT